MNANENLFLSQMAPQEVSIDVLLEKYAKGDERTVGEVQTRVAQALAAFERSEIRSEKGAEFLWAQKNGFVPAGRINSAAGLGLKATLINCFVQGVGDSVSGYDGENPGIYTAISQAAETMRRGGGVGYDFSLIRPYGSLVKGTQSRASGPISYMSVFDASCKTVESAGARRGAQMGVLRIDHPDIDRFITAKDEGDFKNFNLSIGVTDEFMRALKTDDSFQLVHSAEPGAEQRAAGAYQKADGKWVYREILAAELWDQIMQSTYDHAEPGIIFPDRMNAENNLHYCEEIHATNPCGEQPLPAYGCCDLGSLNLTAFIQNPFSDESHFDIDLFRSVAKVAIRMLDLVLDATQWPLEEQKAEGHAKRRIGLGFLGLGSALVMMNLRYDSEEGRSFAAFIAEEMRNASYEASVDLAIEKGAFPKFDADQYLSGAFIKRLPAALQERIRKHGIRNSHCTSIAPTGTITLAFADNASNGIEPAYSWTYNRKKRMPDDSYRSYEVADHAWRLYRAMGNDVSEESVLPKQFVTALQMSANDHMLMMKVVQPFIDTSISKTVNVPEDYPYADFKTLYLDAYDAGLKGLATYRPNSVLGSVLSVDAQGKQERNAAPLVPDEDPLRKQFDSRPAGELQSVTSKVEFTTYDGKQTVYLTVSFITVKGSIDGEEVIVERPFEFFMPASQKTDGQQWITASMRLLSMVARSGGSVARALADLRDVVWDKGMVRCGFITKDDLTKAPLFHDSEVAAIGYALQRILINRGLLDASGNQIPTLALAKKFAGTAKEFEMIGEPESQAQGEEMTYTPTGKKCPDCGSYSLHKIDGCSRCVACHYVGACG